MKSPFIILLLSLIVISCSSIKNSIIEVADDYQYHAGFYLYDPVEDKELVNLNADKYYTPASNTKVYSFYAALNVLPDSIPAFRYIETDSALFVWGLADPSFLNRNLPQGNTYSFLSKAKKIYYSNANFSSPRFGLGWSWDDYNGGYEQEIAPFPIYGNSVYFNIDSLTRDLQVEPSIFRDSIKVNTGDKYSVKRNELSNFFEWDTIACNDCERLRPIYFSDELFSNLLADTLKVHVEEVTIALPDSAKTFYSIPKDSVLKVMMQESDNFIAEHMMLSVAAELTDTLSTKIGIREMSEKINEFVPDKLIWKDGSGLSRYNLFTPRSMVSIWDHLYDQLGEEKLFSLVSVGGVVGTLENWFKAETPYIYAKTGTLSNNFSLSGFLITKSGRRLIFSYMNNNYPTTSTDIKKEMELTLRMVYEKY